MYNNTLLINSWNKETSAAFVALLMMFHASWKLNGQQKLKRSSWLLSASYVFMQFFEPWPLIFNNRKFEHCPSFQAKISYFKGWICTSYGGTGKGKDLIQVCLLKVVVSIPWHQTKSTLGTETWISHCLNCFLWFCTHFHWCCHKSHDNIKLSLYIFLCFLPRT